MEYLNIDQNFAPIIIDKDTQCVALSKSDFRRLHNYLNEFGAAIKDLAEFDGFLSVVAINHKLYDEDFLCSIIYDIDFEAEKIKKIFITKEQYDDFVDLFSRRILFLFEAVNQEKLDNMLLFDVDEASEAGNNWLRGVVRALMIFEEDFIVFDKENYIDTASILGLIAYPEDIETEEERMIVASMEGQENFTQVAIDYLYLLNEEISLNLTQKPETVKNTPKPKRNDLCDCGSGKKYKKCCGK